MTSTLRNILRSMVLSIGGRIAMPSRSIYILNGHFVSRIASASDTAVFARLLEQLSFHVDFVTVEDACRRIFSGEIPSRAVVAFTFDDGFRDCIQSIAPVLESFGINGAFFINPSIVEASNSVQKSFLLNRLKMREEKVFMNWDEIGQLHRRGHCIGNHTMHHLVMNELTETQIKDEIANAKEILEQKLNAPCEHFAIPYGTSKFFNQQVVNIALLYHPYIHTSGNGQQYFYQNRKGVFERRHFEGNWFYSHLNYFLSKQKYYN